MLTDDQVAGLRVAFERIADPITEYICKDVARRVAQAGQFTSTAAYQIWRAQQLGMSRDDVEKAVARILKKSIPEVRELFKQAADVGYNFDIDHLSRDAVAFEDNTSVQQIVAAAQDLAEEDLRNITQTLGFQTPDGTVHPLLEAYQRTTDFAFQKVITGATDYNTAIRQACNKLASGGVKYIDYASGVHTTIEAAIRRNMMGGLGLMVENISQKNHDELGADGWEISAHFASAPDHEPIQGKQYSDAEYQALNDSLVRRIGTLNCGHNAFPIILGVNSPQHTPEELERMREENAKPITYEGMTFESKYAATQYQRRIERSIRAQERRVMLASDNDLPAAKTRLTRLRAEYRRFCNAVDLRTEDERLFVAKPKVIAAQKKPAETPPNVVPTSKLYPPAPAPALVNTPHVMPHVPENTETVIVTNTPVKPDNPTFGCAEVTQEWIDQATPNSHEIKDVTAFEQDGVVYRVDGVNVQLSYDKHEKAVAQLLESKFGGDLRMMPTVNGKYKGIKTPDYLFRGERYDLKTMKKISSARAVFNAIKGKLEQADNFILDITNADLGREEIIRQIKDEIFINPTTRSVKVIILVENGEIVNVFKRK